MVTQTWVHSWLSMVIIYPNFDYSDDEFNLTVLMSNEYVKFTGNVLI